jgi:hypothetical protein
MRVLQFGHFVYSVRFFSETFTFHTFSNNIYIGSDNVVNDIKDFFKLIKLGQNIHFPMTVCKKIQCQIS